MAESNQEILIGSLHPTVSAERFGKYVRASNFDDELAMKLYLWNAQVGEAFHIPIQAAEVALRNKINAALVAQFGADWWDERAFLEIAQPFQVSDIQVATNRILNRQNPLCTGQIVASLSFGFWSGMMDGEYNIPIWSRHLRGSFPHLPARRERKHVAARAKKINKLRNRISHHEPIFQMNISQEHADILEFIGWICPQKLEWIRPSCRMPSVLRMKPKKSGSKVNVAKREAPGEDLTSNDLEIAGGATETGETNAGL